MKVIQTDNFDRDYEPDHLIAGPGLSEEEAKRLAEEKNDRADPHGAAFFMAVPDDYELKEPFVP